MLHTSFICYFLDVKISSSLLNAQSKLWISHWLGILTSGSNNGKQINISAIQFVETKGFNETTSITKRKLIIWKLWKLKICLWTKYGTKCWCLQIVLHVHCALMLMPRSQTVDAKILEVESVQPNLIGIPNDFTRCNQCNVIVKRTIIKLCKTPLT